MKPSTPTPMPGPTEPGLGRGDLAEEGSAQMVATQWNYSYMHGVGFSITLTIFLTAMFLVIGFVGWVYSKPSDAPFILLASLLFAGAMGFSAFCVIYSVVNPLSQFERFLTSTDFLNAFITNELSTGVWGLRVSSLLLAYGLLKAIYHTIVRLPPPLDESRSIQYSTDPRSEHAKALLKQLPESNIQGLQQLYLSEESDITWYTREESVVRFLKDLLVINVCQYGVYVMVLTNLWFLTIIGVHTWQVSLLNWALFFICDDWAFINHYSYTLGQAHPWGVWRIHGFNILLSILVLYVVVVNASGVLVVTILGMLAIFLLVRYLLSVRLTYLLNW